MQNSRHPSFCWAVILLLVGVFTASLDAKSAAWMREPSDSYLKLWIRGISGGQAFTVEDESPFDVARYEDYQINLYYEFGLTKKYTLILRSIPIGFAASGAKSTAYSGLIMGGVRIHIPNSSSWETSVETRVGIEPGLGAKNLTETTYVDDNGKEHSLTYRPTNRKNQLAELEIQSGRSFVGGWIVGVAGYRININPELASSFFSNVQLGFSGGANLRHSYDLSYQRSMKPIEEINVSGSGNTNYIGFNIGVAWKLTKSGSMTFDFGGAPLAEANAFAPSLSVGYESNF